LERIISALGEYAGAIEHIGSTSVPSLAAKPIIEVLRNSYGNDSHPPKGRATDRMAGQNFPRPR
jgi:GrpB-like predicted nucleotidyltransferase (UPF0157 family)